MATLEQKMEDVKINENKTKKQKNKKEKNVDKSSHPVEVNDKTRAELFCCSTQPTKKRSYFNHLSQLIDDKLCYL